jgi:hypothetical protein
MLARRTLALAALLALVSATATASPAATAARSKTYSIPRLFKPRLPKIRARSGIPVLLPSRLRIEVTSHPVAPTDSERHGRYDLDLGYGRQCRGATACFVAFFSGERGGKLGGTPNATLTAGVPAYFHPTSCGASCAPPEIEWVQDGVLYSLQFKQLTQRSERSGMVALANSAIRGGPR